MFIYEWGDIFTMSLLNLWRGFAEFVPDLLGAVVVFIVGWILADWIGRLVTQLIDAVKLDKLLASAGLDEVVARTGYKLHTGGLIGGIVKWLIIVGFLMTSVRILGLTDVSMFLSGNVIGYLGQVLIAVIILIIGFVVANVVKRVVTAATMAVKGPSAQLVGSIARYAVIVFAFAIALPKLLILPQDTFLAILGGFVQPLIWGIALAAALAFGLGGKDAAGRAIERWNSKMDR